MLHYIKAPAGLSMGRLIGKHGSNIKHLQETSGAHIKAQMQSDDDIYVIVRGNSHQGLLAVELVEAQFASWQCSSESYSTVKSMSECRMPSPHCWS